MTPTTFTFFSWCQNVWRRRQKWAQHAKNELPVAKYFRNADHYLFVLACDVVHNGGLQATYETINSLSFETTFLILPKFVENLFLFFMSFLRGLWSHYVTRVII